MNNVKERVLGGATGPANGLETPSIRVATAFRQSAERACKDTGIDYATQWQIVGYDPKKNKIVVRSSSLPERKVIDGVSMYMRDALGYPCTVEFVAEREVDTQPLETFYYINPNVIPGLSDYEGLKRIFSKRRGIDDIYSRLKLTPFSINNDKLLKDAQRRFDEDFFKEISEISCRVFGVTEEELFSPIRTNRVFKARQAIAIFIRSNFDVSFKKLGRLLRRDHSSIIHMTRAQKEIEKFVETEQFLSFLAQSRDVLKRYVN